MDINDVTIFDCLNNNVLVKKNACMGRDYREMKVIEFSPTKKYVQIEWIRADNTKYKEWLDVRSFTKYDTHQEWFICEILGPKKSIVKKFNRMPKG